MNRKLCFECSSVARFRALFFLTVVVASGSICALSLELFSTCELKEDSFRVSILAIKSWLSLMSVQRVTLFQESYDSCARLFPFFEDSKFRCVALNESKDSYSLQMNHLFDAAKQHTVSKYVGYINCDIAVFSEFDHALQNILYSDGGSKKAIVGRRKDVSISNISLDSLMKNISIVREYAQRHGHHHGSFGKDYFIFPREFLRDFPPFLIGRPKWDDWFLTKLLLQEPRDLSIYRLDDSIPVVHMQIDENSWSHEKLGALENEELFKQIWTCQPISDILNVETVVVPANGSERDSFQMVESIPNTPLQLLFARKSQCNETLYLYEDLSFGSEFALSFRKIIESCKRCIHIVHTMTACIYCRRYASACICMHESETSMQQYFQRDLPLMNQQVQQIELLRRRFYILSTAVENGYKVNYQIGAKIPRSSLVILGSHPEDMAYTKGFLEAISGTYEFPPSSYEFITLKPSYAAREFLTILHICILKFTTTSNWEEVQMKLSSKNGRRTHSFQKCVESLGIRSRD
ncbi:uncharacterized protein Gasu_08910 [Galdieria sulphuraria]|uniref:Uncharacterized protein n=1 Tax=Galdieria sulphuraria TaxID=130081 RepID=M2X5Q8_GALSU|nr:uncharacterized protein Gasu_08910 [Galdieria sulphuraria]EME31815.1 hypothetical protein Gasu_08910 [Galdieria sulphuraria]|eukprot:XP_005708335.1 hypothetical protein Gasu_08910 [Galdieria sulphuraria]